MSNKTCAIVGTGQTMGRAIAAAFAREGYDLALVARERSHLEEIAKGLPSNGGSIRFYSADVTDSESLRGALERIVAELGLPEVLIYNVAVLVSTPPSEVTVKEVLETLPENLFGAMECVHSLLPRMKERHSGTIIFTGGGFGILPSTYSASHSIGKAALRNYAQNLHQELANEGVHVATVTITRPVSPGGDYDPDDIAAHYLELVKQPAGEWGWEIVHKEL